MKKHLILMAALCLASGFCRANVVIDLSGTWQFAADAGDVGLDQKWFERDLDGTITLPGSTDEAQVGDPEPLEPRTLGRLHRRHNHLGPAWYVREVEIPEAWEGRTCDLFLERVMWQSMLWVDHKPVGEPQDSLSTPHVYHLGKLAPGRHTLALRIDNRMIHPIGNMGHGYGEQTQSKWNGVVGRIELRSKPGVSIDSCRVFAEMTGRVDVKMTWSGDGEGVEKRLRLLDYRDPDNVLATGPTTFLSDPELYVYFMELDIGWSAENPRLYRIAVDLLRDGEVVDVHEEVFGFRSVNRLDRTLLVGAAPVFLRGNLDCIHFPRTGYPSTNKEDWLRIFRIYQEYNLNHVRFHSWTPPEAAFEAADELGIYIQAEAPLWIDGWMKNDRMAPHRQTEGRPQGLGRGDRTTDEFARAEIKRILDAYGNHPSFVMFCFGNEHGTADYEVLKTWLDDVKAHDPRRLYAASTARQLTPSCDFNATHSIPGLGRCRAHIEFGTDWDYEHLYGKTTLPTIAHEIGQWPMHPDWSICEKFDGTLRNVWLEKMREQARENGVFDDQPIFTAASGALQQRLYKDEIESFLRTPSCAGFQLLSMQDFQGQGEAYVGWLDCFWDSKGTTSPEVFRGYCAPVVALARIPSYVYTEGDAFHCDIYIRNNGTADLRDTSLTASLVEDQGQVVYEQASPISVSRGAVVLVAYFDTVFRFGEELSLEDAPLLDENGVPMAAANAPPVARRLDLVLRLEGKEEANTYPLWVYPREWPEDPDGVVLHDAVDEELFQLLGEGASVVLDVSGTGAGDPKHGTWLPYFWSSSHFPNQKRDTLGTAIRHEHPALADFPTSYFADWQWYRICEGVRGVDLTGTVPASYRPIAQPVSDFRTSRKYGTIFELAVGEGKLLICGYDLSRDLPEVKQLRYSLLNYAAGKDFQPTQSYSVEALRKLLSS